MRDEKKTKEQLLAELTELHRRVAEFEKKEIASKAVEKKLEDQFEFLQTVIDSIPNPIFYKDTKGRFLDCNKAFETRLGLNKEDIVGKTSYELFPKELADKYHELDLISFNHPDEQVYETTLFFGDGKANDVIIYKGTFSDPEGQLAGLVGVTVDITERKQAEEALKKAHEELELRVAARTAELAAANEELRSEISERKRAEEALRASSEKLKLFAYSVAHDLKSPTVGIHGLTRLLARKYDARLDETGRTYCEQILKAAEDVVALVDKINAYAATRETLLVMENVSLKEVLGTVRDEFSEKFASRAIRWSEPSFIPDIKADRVSILRVFRNLVDNALKYGGGNMSRIAVGFKETERSYILSVSDDGVGILPGDSVRIFELFHRSEKSNPVEGTGLGLAIVKEIVEQHKGKAWVESGEGKGAVFCFSISKDLNGQP